MSQFPHLTNHQDNTCNRNRSWRFLPFRPQFWFVSCMSILLLTGCGIGSLSRNLQPTSHQDAVVQTAQEESAGKPRSTFAFPSISFARRDAGIDTTQDPFLGMESEGADESSASQKSNSDAEPIKVAQEASLVDSLHNDQ